jgi:hypothetical protein
MIQSWYRIQFYPSDFLNLVYRYYAAHGTSYICTYYHLDIPHSCADLKTLDDAAYHVTGDLSGLVWEKILFLPIYNTAVVNPAFSGDERGFGKFEQNSELNFPTLYGLTPTTYDFIYFTEPIIEKNSTPKGYPLFRVVNFDRATNSLFDFFKIYLKVHYLKKQEVEGQISQIYSFVDYQKQVYKLDNAITMTKQMEKNTKLELNNFYDQNFGYYIGA